MKKKTSKSKFQNQNLSRKIETLETTSSSNIKMRDFQKRKNRNKSHGDIFA